MKVNIFFNDADYGKFSVLHLGFESNGRERKVPLSLLEYEKVYDFSNDFNSVKFDFFLISAIIYGVDNLLNRAIYSNDGWSRDIEVEFPVVNLDIWRGKEEKLKQILDFLTGDNWTISFTANNHGNFYYPRPVNRRRKKAIDYDKSAIVATSLFSGGLDSFIGVIDKLESIQNNKKILLVSHFDSKSPGPNSDQHKLLSHLKNQYVGKIHWIQSKLALARKDTEGSRLSVENNYRSRSLFFIALGAYLSPANGLIIPENGTISINYPLTPSRVSSLSTRTTHPYVLNKLQDLFDNIGLDITLTNPYSFKTKGEMFEECLNSTFLQRTFQDSVSCGKRGRKQHWSIKNGTEQCGRCMPCIYRRASLNASGFDNEIFGNDVTAATALTHDLPALFSYLKKNIPLDKMKRDILVNGNIPIVDLENYAQMVLRSKQEVLNLFSDKGSNFVKNQLGI